MLEHNFASNLRLLCSYGRSTSELCRKGRFNRQQFNKYLNGHSMPSIQTLRRICDFFGVDETEILLDPREFGELVRVRPPRVGYTPDPLQAMAESLVSIGKANEAFLTRHEGYYFSYVSFDARATTIVRALVRLRREGNIWTTKTVDRKLYETYGLPETVKYVGLATESQGNLVCMEREQQPGRSMWCSMLYGSTYDHPSYLTGVTLSTSPEGSKDIECLRLVWEFLGRQIDLRKALGSCGVLRRSTAGLPDIVINGIDNTRRAGETVFRPLG